LVAWLLTQDGQLLSVGAQRTVLPPPPHQRKSSLPTSHPPKHFPASQESPTVVVDSVECGAAPHVFDIEMTPICVGSATLMAARGDGTHGTGGAGATLYLSTSNVPALVPQFWLQSPVLVSGCELRLERWRRVSVAEEEAEVPLETRLPQPPLRNDVDDHKHYKHQCADSSKAAAGTDTTETKEPLVQTCVKPAMDPTHSLLRAVRASVTGDELILETHEADAKKEPATKPLQAGEREEALDAACALEVTNGSAGCHGTAATAGCAYNAEEAYDWTEERLQLRVDLKSLQATFANTAETWYPRHSSPLAHIKTTTKLEAADRHACLNIKIDEHVDATRCDTSVNREWNVSNIVL
jgi:hypothetical protein